MNPPAELIEALAQDPAHKLQNLGTTIGKIYTDYGLPIDMALDRLEGYSKAQKLAILAGAQNWLIAHRRNSDASEKALDRQRKNNRETLTRFIRTGETGIY